MARPISGRPVVVGIDGSPESAEALRWAIDYARLAGAEITAVIAWENTLGFGFVPSGAHSLEHEARHALEHTVEKVIGEEKEPVPPIEQKVIHGHSTPVLVEASRGARLLVVGDRGYGGFAGLLLGHCGENCARLAPCSVVIVRNTVTA
jgi:nucleotide-binding universal stress UspA family protein